MNETEIAVRLENHEQEIKSAKHRLDELEETGKSIQDLVLSVQKLALNMENMLKEQTKQGDRLDKLESDPVESANGIKKTAVNSIVSSISTALAIGIVYAIAKGMGLL